MKISVLTICYNSAKFIERAITSVLDQEYKNWEHIVVDGNSADNTIEILKKYHHLIWISEPDQGQSDAMNKAFHMASGDLVVYLNADDWFERDAFITIINEFNKSPLLDIVVGNLVVNLSDGKNFSNRVSVPNIEISKIVVPFKYPFPLNPVSYFYKAELQKKIGLFPLDNHYAMDYWFLLRAFYYAKHVSKIDIVLGYFFLDGTNKTSNIDANRTTYKVVLPFVKTFRKDLIVKVIVNYWVYVFIKEFFLYRKYLSPLKAALYNVFLKGRISFAEYERIGFKNSFKLIKGSNK